MQWLDLDGLVSWLELCCRRLVFAGLLTLLLHPGMPALAQSGGVDELVQIFNPGASEPCASAAGDELVLQAGKPCDLTRLTKVVRQAVAMQQRPARRSADANDCGPIDGCRNRRSSFTKLTRISSLAYERRRAGSPRYFGQKD